MKKIGMLIPCTNLTVEYELEYLYNKQYFNTEKYAFYISKLQYKTNYKENKVKFLKDISNDEKNKIKELKYLGVDYITSFCTSASIISGKMINNPGDAIIECSKNRNIKKAFLITPYSQTIGEKVKNFIEQNDIKIMHNINLNLINTQDYFDFGLNSLESFIVENYKKEYGNIIISCTNLPTVHFIKRLQKKLETNIISSNLCMFEKIHEL